MLSRNSALFKLPPGSVRVIDPEEEIFLLYTRLSKKDAVDGTTKFAGLGSVDSKEDMITVSYEIPLSTHPVVNAPEEKFKKRRARASVSKRESETQTLEINLMQDKTMLRSKSGDTGSVLWRVSVQLGQLLINELHDSSPPSLLDPGLLKDCNVLELGAGTGLLGIILSPYVRHYTVTDIDYLIPLLRRNIALNLSSISPKESLPRVTPNRHGRKSNSNHHASLTSSQMTNVTVEALDWTVLQATVPPRRAGLFVLEHADPPDLVVIADCIYNPALLPALVDTINHYSCTDHTRVLVAVELRADDVLREFLELWLASGNWEIWRIEKDESNEALEGEVGSTGNMRTEAEKSRWLGYEYAIWLGWKTSAISVSPAE